MPRFQSREEYERWRAGQQGAPAEAVETAAAEEGEQVYDGPPPGSAAFTDRSRQQEGLSTDRDRTLAMMCHLSALTGFFIPLGNVFGPLVFWMIGKNGSQFVDANGKNALNFHISFTIFFIVSLVVGLFLGPLIIVLFAVGGIAALYAVVMAIVNGIKAKNGEEGEYALSNRFLS